MRWRHRGRQLAIEVARGKAYVILDGTLLRIDRVAMSSGRDRPSTRQAPVPAGERAGHRRPDRTADLGLTGPARRAARHGRPPASMASSRSINTAGVQAVADTASRGGDPAVRMWQRRRRLGYDTAASADVAQPPRSTTRTPTARPPTNEANGELKSGAPDPPQDPRQSQPDDHPSSRLFSTCPSWADQTGKAYGTQQVRTCETCGVLLRASGPVGQVSFPATLQRWWTRRAAVCAPLRQRATSTAAQPGAEPARVMSVIDVSTEQTNRHRAIDPAPRTVGRGDRVRPASRDGARRPVPGAEIESRRSLNPMLRARPQASPRIEESVLLVTV